ncbi:MAG: PepSY domain-containing protein [Methanobacteriaceae archaeon]|jgi:uncharacterized membrane protein YkoI|nr:PepSY domain-containing protein [Methanobacteriaceae archaeon]OPY20544.1 MAG: hypothetical protein A4E26_01842 [Methanobacterium sp. PtaU1.Bin097]
MVNKPTIAILAIVIVVVIGAGIYAGSNPPKTDTQTSDNGTTTTNNEASQSNASQNSSGQNMISAQEAQNIALQYIEEPNATAGTPRLVDEDGKKIYVVPVLMNGSTVGQIEIDAYTGKNVGGAGGVT